MIDKKQLYRLIAEVLGRHNLDQKGAIDLVYGTIAHESNRGTYLRQLSKNFDLYKHAIGIAQMEYNTFCWLCDRFGDTFGFERKDFPRLEHDLALSILLCRLRYRVDPEPIPKTLEEKADYYKRIYNTSFGSATPQDFINAFNKK